MDSMIGRELVGRYRIIRHIGSGHNSTVYLAEQKSMGRNVAVKMLQADVGVDETAKKRFRQEVEVASRLRSPHTVQFYDYGEVEGNPFIVMEFLAGESLQDNLKRVSKLSLSDTWSVTAQIASSLDEAHEVGVLHRDLKPANTHFCVHATPMRPFIKVLDFGFAKITDRAPGDPQLTARQQTVGTPAYMAPERIVEERPVDHRSDLYSLAVMCFEMLTGKLPFDGKTPMLMVLDHVKKPIPPLAAFCKGLPSGLDTFFQRAMAKKAEDRPESARDLANEFQEALHQ